MTAKLHSEASAVITAAAKISRNAFDEVENLGEAIKMISHAYRQAQARANTRVQYLAEQDRAGNLMFRDAEPTTDPNQKSLPLEAEEQKGFDTTADVDGHG